MNKKGFVLMETIIVIVVISIALLTLFSSYNKILSKLKSENMYDNPEYLYMVDYIKSAIVKSSNETECKFANKDTSLLTNLSTGGVTVKDVLTKCITNRNDTLKETFNIKKIYYLTGIGSGANFLSNLSKFDAYMIDYLKRLDVDSNEKILVVEFEKIDRDSDYEELKMYTHPGTTTPLTKTYIASLEW